MTEERKGGRSSDFRLPHKSPRFKPPCSNCPFVKTEINKRFSSVKHQCRDPNCWVRKQLNRSVRKTGRNDPCPCGSGKKYKYCCLPNNSSNPPDTSNSFSECPNCGKRFSNDYAVKKHLQNCRFDPQSDCGANQKEESSSDSPSDDDYVVYSSKYRLNSIAEHFRDELYTVDYPYLQNCLVDLVNYYEDWVTQNDYLVFEGCDPGSDNYGRRFASSAPKRGNRKYRDRAYARFRDCEQDFLDVDLLPSRGSGLTNMLFVTLTIDASHVTLYSSWDRASHYFNNFISSLRNRFGRVSVLKVGESHESGYHHIHCILVFADHWFTAFWHKKSKQFRIPYGSRENNRKVIHKRVSKKGKSEMQIEAERRELARYKREMLSNKEYIDKLWSLGHIDVFAVSNPNKAFRYLQKYLLKSIEYTEDLDWKAKLTLALSWVFHKKAFTVSSAIIHPTDEVIPLIHRDLHYLWRFIRLEGGSITQIDEPTEWTMIGMVVINTLMSKPPPPIIDISGSLAEAVSEVLGE